MAHAGGAGGLCTVADACLTARCAAELSEGLRQVRWSERRALRLPRRPDGMAGRWLDPSVPRRGSDFLSTATLAPDWVRGRRIKPHAGAAM